MIIDTHIHVGQFYDKYFSPKEVHALMKEVGVRYYAVSSITQCEENNPKVISEIKELVSLDGDKVLPVIWMTPDGLNSNLDRYFESGIKWRMVKIHTYFNKEGWFPGLKLMDKALGVARKLQVPFLIHTGMDDCCRSSLFEPTIANNPDVTFVLAHGKPLDECISIIQKYSNAYADSSFMPVEGMKECLDAGVADKLLWGTDMFIPKHFYPDQDMPTYYFNKLSDFKSVSTDKQFRQVIWENAKSIFKL